MKRKIILLLTMLLCASCEKESLTIYEEFAQKYHEAHPGGYDEKPQWYTFNAIATDYNFYSSERIIREIDFVGLIDFREDRFSGSTYKFQYKKTTTKMIDNEVIQVIEKERMLCDGNYYQRETINHKDPINKEEKTKGCEGIESLAIGFPFDEFFFNPFFYESILSVHGDGNVYKSITIGSNYNYVIINRILGTHLMDIDQYTQTRYYLNEKCELTKIVVLEDYFNAEGDSSTLAKNEYSYSFSGCLEVTKEQEIVVPTDYDEVEEDKDHLWGLAFTLELKGEVET